MPESYLDASIDGYRTRQLFKTLGKLLDGILGKTGTFLTIRGNLFPKLNLCRSSTSYKPYILQQTSTVCSIKKM